VNSHDVGAAGASSISELDIVAVHTVIGVYLQERSISYLNSSKFC